MPIYTWACEACEDMEEVERKFEDCYIPPEDCCKRCGEEKWRKLLNAGVVRWRFID